MKIHHEPLESVMPRSSIIIVVDVQVVSESKEEGHWKSRDFTALPVEVIFGQMTRSGAFSCRYSQGMPHMRGDVSVSPLVTGSGMELNVKEGDRIVFLLESEVSVHEPVTLLRAEPLARIEHIRQLIAGSTGGVAHRPPRR